MNNILSSVANLSSSNVSQQQQPIALAERADIHKSCKSIETLLNILNDYCEAATAIVALQKKLTRALRDTAGSKVTNEIAANALNASASIFDALAEVDAKFVKIADKEYDTISTEVKRWFKKLAKEEKAHDERIASANAKIKQAGLNFEKKSKKKSVDAQDEHSRYIHLISTLGPEITQEKYNHTLQITQRHTTTIYSVAASLSRIADTEWARSCESVRRFAPTIGSLGEWRSLCEGGWIKEPPGDLVDVNEKVEDKLRLNTIQERVELEEEDKDDRVQHQDRQYQQLQQVDENLPPPGYRRTDGESATPELPQRQYTPRHLDPPHNDREATTSTSASYPSQTQTSSSGSSPILQRNPDYGGTASHSPVSTPAAAPPMPSPTPASMPRSALSSGQPSPQYPAQGYRVDRDQDTTIAAANPTAENNLRPPSPSQYRLQSHSRDESPASDRERLFSDPVTGSVRSLSAFPAPPTHFPLPPPRPRDPPSQSKLNIVSIKESKEEQTDVTREGMSESPLPLEADERRRDRDGSTLQAQQQPRRSGGGEKRSERQRSNSALDVPYRSSMPTYSGTISTPVSITPTRLAPVDDRKSTNVAEDDELRAREFGMLREERESGPAGKARTFNVGGSSAAGNNVEFPSASMPIQGRSGLAERTDTGNSTTGSIVAAMRSRYSNNSGSQSPPPRSDLPRLHTSVSEMANRYQSPPSSTTYTASSSNSGVGELRDQVAPRTQQSPLQPMSKSPPPAMGRRVSLSPTPERIEPRQHGGVSSSSLTPTPSLRPLPPGSPGRPRTRDSLENAEDHVQWRRMEELAEIGYRTKERELREREQEIFMRERELERDRARLLSLKDGLASSSASANDSDHGGHSTSTGERGDSSNSYGANQLQPRPRERRISLRRSRQDSQPQTPQPGRDQLLPPSQSPLQGHLIPSSSSPNLRERPQSHHSYSSPPPSSSGNQDFNTSSASGSGSGNSLYPSRSTESPSNDKSPPQQQEKKGGWMRRLSMPVSGGLPFSLDSSKRHMNNSNSSTTSTTSTSAAGMKQLGAGILGGKGVGMSDDRRNHSSIALGFGGRDSRDGDREREYGYAQPQPEQDGGRFGGLGLGLGRRSHDATRSATNLNLGLGRNR